MTSVEFDSFDNYVRFDVFNRMGDECKIQEKKLAKFAARQNSAMFSDVRSETLHILKRNVVEY